MKRIIILLIVPLALMLIAGCGPTIRTVHYGVANHGCGAKYLTKPLYVNSTENERAAIYASGKYYRNFGEGYYSDELSRFGEFLIHRVHSQKHHNISYGVLGYKGRYRVNELTDFRGNKSFYGGGATFGFNVRIPHKRIEWRAIGVQSTLLYEDGEYATFRKDAKEAEHLVAGEYPQEVVRFNDYHPDNLIVNVSANTEFIINLDKASLGIYGSLGYTWGVNGRRNYGFTGSFNVLLNKTNTTFFIQQNVSPLFGYSTIGISQRLF